VLTNAVMDSKYTDFTCLCIQLCALNIKYLKDFFLLSSKQIFNRCIEGNQERTRNTVSRTGFKNFFQVSYIIIEGNILSSDR